MANKYCKPIIAPSAPIALPSFTKLTITTAKAPVAPEIIPGRPPKIAVTKPIIKAPYKPTIGEIPATKAKATASGTSAKATVNPESRSSFTEPCFLSINSKVDFIFFGLESVISARSYVQYI